MTNNMKNIFKGLAVAVCFSALLTSCTKNYEYFNTNQHEATQEQMDRDGLKTGSFFAQMLRTVYVYGDGVNLDSDYQIAYNLLADSYAGYLAPTGSWNNGVHTGSYFMTESWRRAMFSYSYTKGVSAYVQLVQAAAEQEHILALADIVKVAILHRVTDYYGPIPYSMIGADMNVAYDSQEDIYNAFFEELGSAIDVLNDFKNANPGSALLADYDVVYGGDVAKWIRFANSLRLRLAMRVVYADPVLAKVQAEKSVADMTGVIVAAADGAKINKSYEIYTHPVTTINGFNGGETQMGASMDSYLNGYADPRLPKYFKEAGKGGYHGVRNGIHSTTWDAYRNATGNVSAPNTENTELVWLAASEVAFLRAEGALRGWNMGGDAKTFYEQGVRLSFEETGAGNADSYLANSTATPAAFVDATNNGGNAAAKSSITIAWDAAADTETNLERIITQKWIAMYPNGCEAWAEYRRTGYPALFPVMNNDSEGAVGSDLQIRRVPYPHDEYSTNASGVASGVAKLGGADNVGTKLWWDKKPR